MLFTRLTLNTFRESRRKMEFVTPVFTIQIFLNQKVSSPTVCMKQFCALDLSNDMLMLSS